MGHNFLADLRFGPNERIWHGNTGGEKHMSRGPATPHPKGAELGRPPNVWDLIHTRPQHEK